MAPEDVTPCVSSGAVDVVSTLRGEGQAEAGIVRKSVWENEGKERNGFQLDNILLS